MGVAAQILTLLAFAAGGGDPPAPQTQITPILHTGDPAPGIPDATMVWIGIPEIDAAGNVLIYGFFQIDGQATAHTAIWYGGAGTLQLIAYDDMQAPDLPPGMVFDYLLAGRLSETGWIGYRANLKGPGIVPGVNDIANFAGPPGDIRNILQGGDPAPGLEPGTVIDVSEGFGLTARLSDNAALLVIAWLSGPDVDESNDKAIWIGPRDNLQLVWREGMEAPGTEPGVTFDWSDFWVFNDTQIAFRGGLVGDSIDESNDIGQWLGSPGNLSLVTRAGDPAPGFGPGIILAVAGGGVTTINALGYTTDLTLVEGPGIDEQNDLVLYVGQPADLDIVRREGDPAPEAGPGVEFDAFSEGLINESGEILYSAKYRGFGIDESNDFTFYFGSFSNAQVTLRDGEQAPHLPTGTVLARVGSLGVSMLNDVGNVIVGTELAGPGVDETNRVVVWFWDRIRGQWSPLLRSGTIIDSRTVFIPDINDLTSAYQNKSGGSDGVPPSLNDQGVLAMRVSFTDETHGVFLLRLVWAGDNDGDGDVDLADLGEFQLCFTGSKGGVSEECTTFDFDDDEDVDLLDFECFLGATTGPH